MSVEQNAITIGKFHEDWTRRWDAPEGLPKGWQRLGSGCSRTGYLGPDGLVYKCGMGIAQYQEYLNYHWLSGRRLHPNVRIPEFDAYQIGEFEHVYRTPSRRIKTVMLPHFVLVTEFIDGRAYPCCRAGYWSQEYGNIECFTDYKKVPAGDFYGVCDEDHRPDIDLWAKKTMWFCDFGPHNVIGDGQTWWFVDLGEEVARDRRWRMPGREPHLW